METIRNPMTAEWYYVEIWDGYFESIGSEGRNYILLGTPGWGDHPMLVDKDICRSATYEEVCEHNN